MASTNTHRWRATDTIWHVARDFYQRSGYTDVPTFVLDIRDANPTIRDWMAVPTTDKNGNPTTIVLPYATS